MINLSQLVLDDQVESKDIKQSGLGIASFVISFIAGTFVWGVLIVAIIPADQLFDNEDIFYCILGLCALIGLVLELVGIGLGIFGLLSKNKKKLFSVLGIIGCIIPSIIIIILLIIGNNI